ncbi:2-dehydro-3-deoxygalactonokinase [Selenomonas sp. TAMA-11512]|uniref:2-dehydro-3-deoxygalactonokinase n=1 Tax=Selenomonas sp. TAMA-11512 TaxID=3095337 RepID=UPI00308F0DA3|nr:2-dehydro-3-deoxygalactonokinase [Selenomonas sp. TAMA-11512]
MKIATIDGGTTNTRVYLWKDDRIIGEAKRPVGVRNTAMDGSNTALLQAIRDALLEAAESADVSLQDLDGVVAAGMLTSNLGIAEIPHIAAPVRLDALAKSIVFKHVPQVWDSPIAFVPGIRNISEEELTDETFPLMDIMRGEETEAAGIWEDLEGVEGSAIVVLPGSHHKYILMDDGKNILGCVTMLTGELLRALTENTILADSVMHRFADVFDRDAFLQGVEYHGKMGVLHAAFMGRVLDLFGGRKGLACQNYLLGILLADELAALKKHPWVKEMKDRPTCIVAGKPIWQEAYRCMFEGEGWHVRFISDEKEKALSGRGAIALLRRSRMLKEEK